MSNTTNITDYNYGTDDYYGGYYYTPHEWFAWSRADLVLQVVLGSISTLSSALILYIIYKSPMKLRTTYHRIMALLSTFIILTSLPMALATLPIPSSYVPYKGLTLGTYGTCTAQAFLIYFGNGAAMDTALCLAWYYVCSALGVSKRSIEKFYEPILYTYIIVASIVGNSWYMSKGVFNIRPWSAYCGLSPVPSACWDGTKPATDVECAWPERPHPYFQMIDFFRGYIIFSYVMIVLAMMIVIFIVCRNERKFAHKCSSSDTNGEITSNETEGEKLPTRLKQSRIIVRQACMYICTFILTWILVLIPWNQDSPKWMDITESILIPIQGLWNMLIFVYIKIGLIRKANCSIDSNWKALKTLLSNPDVVPDMILSGMDNVVIASRSFQENDFEDDEEGRVPRVADPIASNPSAYDDLSMNTPSKATDSWGNMSTDSIEQKSLHWNRNVVDQDSDHMHAMSITPSESTGGGLLSYGAGLSNEMPKITED
mmetsp:Transcript_17144/g.25683  ORF Transcript_17144/g.25683 Transcript_17144/m.25683 type:complete len:486 (-) Transcript_17144:353-1810(-)